MTDLITASDFEAACEVEIVDGPVAEYLMGVWFGWRLV